MASRPDLAAVVLLLDDRLESAEEVLEVAGRLGHSGSQASLVTPSDERSRLEMPARSVARASPTHDDLASAYSSAAATVHVTLAWAYRFGAHLSISIGDPPSGDVGLGRSTDRCPGAVTRATSRQTGRGPPCQPTAPFRSVVPS